MRLLEMPFRISITTALAGAGLLASLVSIAAALAGEPEKIPAAGSDWRVECTNNLKTLDCRAFLEVVQKNSNQVVTAFTVRYPAETKKPVMMLQLPLGILVSESVLVEVDGSQPERTAVQTCTAAGCFVGATMPEALINTMLTGKQLKIIFYDASKQRVTVTLPLAGFALAYNKIKS
jgi:invasion protein IalB